MTSLPIGWQHHQHANVHAGDTLEEGLMPTQEHSDRRAGPDSSQNSGPSADDAPKATDKDEFVVFDLGDIELIETKVFG